MGDEGECSGDKLVDDVLALPYIAMSSCSLYVIV